jgi:hypothetical protein
MDIEDNYIVTLSITDGIATVVYEVEAEILGFNDEFKTCEGNLDSYSYNIGDSFCISDMYFEDGDYSEYITLSLSFEDEFS